MVSTFIPFTVFLNLLIWNLPFRDSIQMAASKTVASPPGGGNVLDTNEALEGAMRNAWTEYGPEFQNFSKPRPVRSRLEPGIPTLLSPYFQPMTSEWDSLISIPKKPPVAFVPNFLNNVLSAVMRFQVNHDEEVDVLEKIGLGVLVGTLVSTWVLLGIGIGGIPIQWILSKRDIQELITIDEFVLGHNKDDLREIEGRVKTAIGKGWLQDLK